MKTLLAGCMLGVALMSGNEGSFLEVYRTLLAQPEVAIHDLTAMIATGNYFSLVNADLAEQALMQEALHQMRDHAAQVSTGELIKAVEEALKNREVHDSGREKAKTTSQGEPVTHIERKKALSVSISPDGRTLAYFSGRHSKSLHEIGELNFVDIDSRKVRRYDFEKLWPGCHLNGHPKVLFGQGVDHFVICDARQECTVRNLSHPGQEIRNIPTDGRVGDGAFAALSPDGRYLVRRRNIVVGQTKVEIIDLLNPAEPPKLMHTDDAFWFSGEPIFSPDSRTFAYAYKTISTAIVDLATGCRLAKFEEENAKIMPLAFLTKDTLAVQTSRRPLEILNWRTERLTPVRKATMPSFHLAIHGPSGYLVNMQSNPVEFVGGTPVLQIFNAKTGALIDEKRVLTWKTRPSEPTGFSVDGTRLFAIRPRADRIVSVWDVDRIMEIVE